MKVRNGMAKAEESKAMEKQVVTVDELKEYRESVGMSQQKVADAAGVSRAIISKIENKRVRLTRDMKELLDKVLGIDLAEEVKQDVGHVKVGEAFNSVGQALNKAFGGGEVSETDVNIIEIVEVFDEIEELKKKKSEKLAEIEAIHEKYDGVEQTLELLEKELKKYKVVKVDEE